MNDLYHWHAERMVDLEMQEIRREIAQASLLREAGLSRRSLLSRAIDALRNLLLARKKSFQNHHSDTSQTYQSANNSRLKEIPPRTE